MSEFILTPGIAVKGYTPGRYAKRFTGTLITINGEGVNRFAIVKRDDGKIIKIRPAVLEAIAA
jgi:hypothetical protein